MRKILIVISTIVSILLIGAVITTHIVITKKLPDIINALIIPKAEKSLGLRISLDDAKLHLLGGKITVNNVKVSNPTITDNSVVLAMDELLLKFSLLPLISQKFEITDLNIDDIKININRDKNDNFNFKPQKQTDSKQSATTSAVKKEKSESKPKPKTESKASKSEPLKLAIHNFICNTIITYTDEKISTPPFTMPFSANLSAKNITTIGSVDDKWGTFSISGSLLDNPEVFKTVITGEIAPISDPAKISMNLDGTITDIDIEQLEPYTNDLDIAAKHIAVAIKLQCRNGNIDPTNSKLILTMDSVSLSGKLAQQTGNIQLPTTLTVNVPIRGTIESPEVDIVTAIITTVMKNMGGIIGTMLENTTIDGKKLDGDLGEAAKVIGNFLKGF